MGRSSLQGSPWHYEDNRKDSWKQKNTLFESLIPERESPSDHARNYFKEYVKPQSPK